MSIIPGGFGSSLVKSYDLRKAREMDPSSILRSEVSCTGSDSDPATLVEMELFVQKVSVFAEEGLSGKTVFSVMLELDSGPNPSNQPRRTEAVRGLALDVEEKEFPVLARLAGRKLGILLERRTSRLDFEKLEKEKLDLVEEVKGLRKKSDSLSNQLQFVMDQIRDIS